MWRNTIRWGSDLSIRKTTNVVSLVLKGIWSSVSCYLWTQGLNFKRLQGENYYCYFDRYILSQQNNAQIFQKLFLKDWILKKEFFLRQFFELPYKVEYIISGTDYYQWSDITEIFHLWRQIPLCITETIVSNFAYVWIKNVFCKILRSA